MDSHVERIGAGGWREETALSVELEAFDNNLADDIGKIGMIIPSPSSRAQSNILHAILACFIRLLAI